jgi:hypothetical protein
MSFKGILFRGVPWIQIPFLVIVFFMAINSHVYAQAPETGSTEELLLKMQEEISELKSWKEARELEDLRQAAQAEVQAPQTTPKVFQGGERALQALNPEISITGDLFARYINVAGSEYSGGERSGFFLRGFGLHLQANLDPFSLFKGAVHLSPEGAELEEGYITWVSVLPGFNITLGAFRQQLGVVNRWHKHALDEFDFPLMLMEPFGPGGLNQTGVSFDILLPKLWAHEETITLQITNGQNDKAFSGEFFSIPTTLLRIRSYWDLNRDTYLDLGLTGIFGFNNARGVPQDDELVPTEVFDSNGNPIVDKDGNPVVLLANVPAAGPANQKLRYTGFGGADLTIAWEPSQRSHYAGLTWRTEFLYGYQEQETGDPISWMGGYTGLDAKVWRGVNVGFRADLVQPWAVDNKGHYIWQVAPYVNYMPSEFVRFHLEYNATDGDQMPLSHRLIFQVVFAAGPHKHDKY